MCTYGDSPHTLLFKNMLFWEKVWVGGEIWGGGLREGDSRPAGNEPNGSYPSSFWSTHPSKKKKRCPLSQPTSSVHYLFSSHRLNLAMLHSGLGHTLRHVLAASLVLQKPSKHVPESAVACSSSSVWWQNCEWRRTAPTVFMSSKEGRGSSTVFFIVVTLWELLQTTKPMLRAGFLLQAWICSVYIPALPAPPWSTAALDQTNTDWLFTPDLPHLYDQQNKNNMFTLLPAD